MKAKAKSKAKTKCVVRKRTANKTVLVLRTCDANLCSREGKFQWSGVGAITTAPDWNPANECGNGLHGWLWGSGDWSLKDRSKDVRWMVIEVDAESIVDLRGKVKFPAGKTIAVEKTWGAAMGFIRGHSCYATTSKSKRVATGDSGHAAATGYYGHAAATGYSGHAAATGNYGHAAATGDSGHAAATGYSGHAAATGDSGHAAATGYYGHAAATGYSGHAAATGEYGHAAATGNSGHAAATGYYGHAAATGYSGHAAATGNYGHAAATGDYGWAIAGYSGKAKAGKNGCVTMAYHDGARLRVAVGYVGEGLKEDTFYTVNPKGEFVEVPA